ncbi:hypothetical protein LDENG_00071220 [Lucifuga dentata]|nr:hypothetical protein LDENG_00071220 [Lucifuga dentata]
MYNTCNTTNTGEVSASAIMQYLQSMTAQSSEQDRLAALQCLLDPDCQDPFVSRETFHSTMREWIAQCSQDRSFNKADLVSGLDFSSPQSKDGSSESHQCTCDAKDLLGTVAELKHAHHKLSEQNSSLLRTVAQCEDVNLQLTLEITELRAKLASAQRSAVRTRSLTEELEETRRAFKEAQDRVSRTQSSYTKLSNEIDCLKVHIRRLEDKNEKLTFERTCSEDSINKLRKVNTELRAELEETLVMLTLRDREITKKDILMDKMKNSHVENHNIIEGLQSEMMRLQEHSHQVLLRYDKHCISPHSLYSRDPPNHRSLQSEMQDMQQHHGTLDELNIPSLHTHTDGFQSIIHRIKSAELAHLLHNKYPERESASVEIQERPFPHRQQQQSIKQQLVNVLQELELQKSVWEERGEKVEERWRAWEQEKKQSQTGNQTQTQETRKVAVVNWWKALNADGAKAQTGETQLSQTLSETRAKLQQAEQTITDMREQVCHRQDSLRFAQECVAERKTSSVGVGVLLLDKATNTEQEEPEGAGEKLVKDLRDAAVATDPVENTEEEQVQFQVTGDRLLVTLRRMEAMVSSALETAELVRESEQRVSQVKVKMESIAQRVEEALGRAADTDNQLSVLEARITEKHPTQSPDPREPTDPTSDSAGFPSESFMETKDGDKVENTPPPPLILEVSEPPQLPMNGMMAVLQKYSFSVS